MIHLREVSVSFFSDSDARKRIFVCSIIFRVKLKIALRMVTCRAYLRGTYSDCYMSAVAAFPYFYFAFGENLGGFHIAKQCAITLFVVLFNCGYEAEFCRKSGKALLLGGFGKAFVHIRPFIVFTVCGVSKVFRGIAYTAKFLESKLCMLLFIVCCFEKESGNLFETLFFCN